MKEKLQNIAIATVAVLVSLVLAEYLVRAFTHFPIYAPGSNRVYDDRLIYRIDSNVAGIDRMGFRNPKSYEGDFPDIAVVGDSFTYGFNVVRAESWPGVLEQALGERIYNYGVGGYNLLQYVELVRLAAEKGVKRIIVAVFPGNDLSICRAMRLKYWSEGLFESGARRQMLATLCPSSVDRMSQTPRELMVDRPKSFKQWLKRRSAAYGILRFGADFLFNRRDNFATNRFGKSPNMTQAAHDCGVPNEDFFFEINGVTDFVPRTLEGFSGTLDIATSKAETAKSMFSLLLRQMNGFAASKGAELSFVLIPTQARIARHMLEQSGRTDTSAYPKWLRKLTDLERTAFEQFRDSLKQFDIPVKDATPWMATAYEKAVAENLEFYPCRDGHPLKEGYSAIAHAAQSLDGVNKRTGQGN